MGGSEPPPELHPLDPWLTFYITSAWLQDFSFELCLILTDHTKISLEHWLIAFKGNSISKFKNWIPRYFTIIYLKDNNFWKILIFFSPKNTTGSVLLTLQNIPNQLETLFDKHHITHIFLGLFSTQLFFSSLLDKILNFYITLIYSVFQSEPYIALFDR